MKIEVNTLGPLEVRMCGKAVDFGGPVSRRILSSLALRPDQVLPLEDIVRGAWGDTPPASGEHQVRKLVSSLRLLASGQWDVVATTCGGYRLNVTSEESDLLRFNTIRASLPRNGPLSESDIDLFHKSARLWRGTPVAGTEPAGFDEDIKFLRDEHVMFIANMARTFAAHGVGKQTHRYIKQAMGIYAGDEYAQEALEEARGISLGIPRSVQNVVDVPRLALPDRKEQVSALPHDVPHFQGRETEIAEICEIALERTRPGLPVIAIGGMAGVGKTAVAVRAAHHMAPRFTDGVLYVHLGGYSPTHDPVAADEAIAILLVQLGFAEGDIPRAPEARVAMWRSRTRTGNFLVVADDACSAEQAAPLIPTSKDAVMLVTSRLALTALDGAHHLPLGLPTEPECRGMLQDYLGSAAPELSVEDSTKVVRWCGRLPLALRVAAAQIARSGWGQPFSWPPANGRPTILDFELPGCSLMTSLMQSLNRLSHEQLDGFLNLAQAPHDEVTPDMAMRRLKRPPGETFRMCRNLAEANVLLAGEHKTYIVHPLLRETSQYLPTQVRL